jgi:hypothetical protein
MNDLDVYIFKIAGIMLFVSTIALMYLFTQF